MNAIFWYCLAVADAHDWLQISAGRMSVCGIDIHGAAWCWGANFDGALGDGTTTDRSTPTLVAGP